MNEGIVRRSPAPRREDYALGRHAGDRGRLDNAALERGTKAWIARISLWMPTERPSPKARQAAIREDALASNFE
jgi:hypothetical protein